MSIGVLHGRVALVTGASRGIGAAVAVELARLGAHVVLVARTQGGLEETDDLVRAAGGAATLLPLDLAEPDTIDPVGPSLFARFGRLDILVHNAGVLGSLTPAAHVTPKDFAACVAINFAATYRLIRSCAPVLLASDAGRAVFVTSHVARHPRAFWSAYGATKAAAENFVLSWADEVEGTALRVNLFDPGRVATRMRARAYPAEDASVLPKPEAVAPELAALCVPAEMRHGAMVRRGI